MSSTQSAEWSRNQAAAWGERHGRTISRVLGDGLRSLSNPEISPTESVDRVHAGMILTALGLAFATPRDGLRLGIFTLLLGTALWNHGQA